MSSLAPAAPTSKGMLWTGRILSGLIVAFMLFAVEFRIAQTGDVAAGNEGHGVSASPSGCRSRLRFSYPPCCMRFLAPACWAQFC